MTQHVVPNASPLSLDVPMQFIQTQVQTGYAPELHRPEAVHMSPRGLNVANDTGLDRYVMSSDPESFSKSGPSIKILEEKFNVELDDELGIVVSHPIWSLMGYGHSIAEAEEMLMRYAQDLAVAMIKDSPIDYTNEGNRLRDFVLGFLYLSIG